MVVDVAAGDAEGRVVIDLHHFGVERILLV